MNCIIICAGEATRWNNHLGVPKHLIEVDGETILQRTVRLIRKYCNADTKIYIVVKNLKDKRYFVEGSATVCADLETRNKDADKFLSSRHLWSNDSRTIVFYGDVWFSDDAMKTIIKHKEDEWVLFANKDECFAQSFYPKDKAEHLKALESVRDMHCSGDIGRCGGWEHYRKMNGYPVREHKYGKRFFLIDDLTDDFDYPKDYDEWIKRYKESKKS